MDDHQTYKVLGREFVIDSDSLIAAPPKLLNALSLGIELNKSLEAAMSGERSVDERKVSVDARTLLDGVLAAPGRHVFRLMIENGALQTFDRQAAIGRAGGDADTLPGGHLLTTKQAAAMCQCSLWWFSRNWKNWGLHPSRLGRLLFEEAEIGALLKSRRITRRGRPPKGSRT